MLQSVVYVVSLKFIVSQSLVNFMTWETFCFKFRRMQAARISVHSSTSSLTWFNSLSLYSMKYISAAERPNLLEQCFLLLACIDCPFSIVAGMGNRVVIPCEMSSTQIVCQFVQAKGRLHRAPLLKGYAESQIHSGITARLWCKPTPGERLKAAATAGISFVEHVSFSGWTVCLL